MTDPGGRRPWPELVSVIVPVRNGAGVIGEQLEALSRQDYTGEWEVVVADNGSTDGTSAVVRSWEDRLPSLRLVDASGPATASQARNAAVEVAKGEFLACCDADDVVTPSWLRELVAAAGGPGVVVGGSFDETTLNPGDVPTWMHWRGAAGVGDDEGERLPTYMGFLPFARGANCGCDRDVWAAVGGWQGRFLTAEDVDFSWRAQQAGFELRAAPRAVVQYRLRAELRATMRQGYTYGRSEVRLFAAYRNEGLHRPRARHAARAWLALLARTPQGLLMKSWRGRWSRAIAHRTGRLVESLRTRTWYP